MAASHPLIRDTFEELDIVRLLSVIYADDAVFEAGTLGTIVFRHPRGEAYEVEVVTPVAAVLTLRDADLAAA